MGAYCGCEELDDEMRKNGELRLEKVARQNTNKVSIRKLPPIQRQIEVAEDLDKKVEQELNKLLLTLTLKTNGGLDVPLRCRLVAFSLAQDT